MRFVSRGHYVHPGSNVIQLPISHSHSIEEPELTAMRGLLIAASLSVVFWGLCLTAVWLFRARA